MLQIHDHFVQFWGICFLLAIKKSQFEQYLLNFPFEGEIKMASVQTRHRNEQKKIIL